MGIKFVVLVTFGLVGVPLISTNSKWYSTLVINYEKKTKLNKYFKGLLKTSKKGFCHVHDGGN